MNQKRWLENDKLAEEKKARVDCIGESALEFRVADGADVSFACPVATIAFGYAIQVPFYLNRCTDASPTGWESTR